MCIMDLSDQASQRERLPIGRDDYKKVIDENCIYIDKTLLIKDFWRSGSEVMLVTRPRRFGKSMALSTLKYFFEKSEQSTAYLFEKSKIWQEEGFKELQGTYPVIHISFKDIKASTWEEAYQKMKSLLAQEVRRTLKPLLNKMDNDYKKNYEALLNETATKTKFEESLFFITEVFKECIGKNTIILIDEYDAPITYAYANKFYDEMIGFMRQLLSKALKGNPHLHKGFMTGVVRTAKDGILSGLNNPRICTMLDRDFSDKFGFVQSEVEGLLKIMGRLDQKEEVRSWYNGYVIGAEYLLDPMTVHLAASVYNPWSILSYLQGGITPKTYWVNTGSTELLERIVAEADETTQKELKALIEGKSLENKQINQDIVLLDLDRNRQEPWSFLFFAGYLTANNHIFQEDSHYYTLSVPNKEISQLYKKLIINAIGKNFSAELLKRLLDAFIIGDIAIVNKLLGDFINSLCSFHDLPQDDVERSLHMFVLGLLASLSERYVIKSNLESGSGRYDIAMYPKRNNDLAVVIEFKKGKDLKLEKLADQALKQIKANKYESSLKDFGYSGKVLCYGIAIFKKHLVAKIDSILV